MRFRTSSAEYCSLIRDGLQNRSWGGRHHYIRNQREALETVCKGSLDYCPVVLEIQGCVEPDSMPPNERFIGFW